MAYPLLMIPKMTMMMRNPNEYWYESEYEYEDESETDAFGLFDWSQMGFFRSRSSRSNNNNRTNSNMSPQGVNELKEKPSSPNNKQKRGLKETFLDAIRCQGLKYDTTTTDAAIASAQSLLSPNDHFCTATTTTVERASLNR